MKSLIPNLLLIVLLIIFSTPAQASIEVSKASPDVGERITLTFSVAVDTLTVTYRPNSSVAKTETLVNDPPATTMEWASKEPGLVSLAYLDADGSKVSRDMSIRFDGISGSGIAVMLFAGIVLFGGATTAFRTLFKEQDEGRTEVFDPEEMPDT